MPTGHAAAAVTAKSAVGRWLAFVGLGLLGGVVGGILIELSQDFFEFDAPPDGAADTQGILNAEQKALVSAAQSRTDRKNVPLAMGFVGLAVGTALGLAQGLAGDRADDRNRPGVVGASMGPARCSLRDATAGLAAGAVCGAGLGALGGLVAVLVRDQLGGWNTLDQTGQPDPLLVQLHTMAIQLPSWISIAVAMGLAAVAARRGAVGVRIAGLAILAVLFASVVYPTLASLLFQMDDPDGVIPGGSLNRLFWATLNAGLIGLIIGRPGKPAASGPAPSGSQGSA
ncbi:MAG: hypothetical protein EXS05_09675 [Planctomycetaceae bacterium]|nr:hypothetical protein [Planctomycetaceae bacterium]